MSFFEILSALLIEPLKLVFEIIYVLAYRYIGNPGLSIIALSLIMNFLVLPLYRRADAMQEEARDTEKRLHKGVSHIKKAFSGDEQMMILQTYYRQNNYKPTDALHGSVSLLLEIPFFIAAYQFLSKLELLTGVPFGPIADLSAPDGLLVLGGITVNLLPIIMTLVNVISSVIFLRGHPLKTKLQLYAMALFFLVFLYTSPSGLVFYWTLNNVFSLCKTIFYKLKNPKKTAGILVSLVGVAAIACAVIYDMGGHNKLRIVMLGAGLLMQLPLVLMLCKKKNSVEVQNIAQPNKKRFMLCSLFLAVLVGGLIPSTYIASSPQEFVDFGYYISPLWYVVNATCLSIGIFVIWMGVFYWLANPKGKVIFERVMCVVCVAALVDYMFFGTNLGIISWTLQYENGLSFTRQEQLINIAVLAVITVGIYFASKKYGKAVGTVILAGVIALGGMSAVNIYKISVSIKGLEVYANADDYGEIPSFELSKTGKNVVVLMLDRAEGELVPYIMNERPELVEKFDGFTYYANTISHGLCTNFGTPGLFGGYEYTPIEMNRRDTETLESKHNEALKVMPVIFMGNGYDVTLIDPTYAGYQWVPDLTVFDEYPQIKAYGTETKFIDVDVSESKINDTMRNMFCFAVMKASPVIFQDVIYAGGTYNQSNNRFYLTSQTILNLSTAHGKDPTVSKYYNELKSLPEMSVITDEASNTFLVMTNDLTHNINSLLQKPDYTLQDFVDNSAYDSSEPVIINGKKLNMNTTEQVSSYHMNMAAYILLGDWFDYLRENDVYDNTRIIIVADHGFGFDMIDGMYYSESVEYATAEFAYPLLLVKDFDSKGFTTSYDFMTNADVPTLATSGVIENPTNPFTGKAINSDEKTAHDQFVIISDDSSTLINNGNTFMPAYWASVHDDLWDMDNWSVSDEKTVLKEYALP